MTPPRSSEYYLQRYRDAKAQTASQRGRDVTTMRWADAAYAKGYEQGLAERQHEIDNLESQLIAAVERLAALGVLVDIDLPPPGVGSAEEGET